MSKYAFLPDIDTAPDVYETPDLPSVLVSERDDDSDNELVLTSSHSQNLKPPTNLDIDHQTLDQSSARKKFASAPALDGIDVDFSSSLLRKPSRPSTRYPPRPPRQSFETSEYSILPRGYAIDHSNPLDQTETPLERLRRLRFEIDELEEELEQQSSNGQSTAPSSDPVVDPSDPSNPKSSLVKGKEKAEPTPAELLMELQHIRDQLGKLSTSAQSSQTPSTIPSNLREREAYAKALLQKLTQNSQTSSKSKSTEKPQTTIDKTLNSSTPAKLDARLSAIENLLGSSSLLQATSNGDINLPPPLLVTIGKLEHQLSLLTQPRHLDTISRRVKVIVTDLERVHEARRKLTDHRPLSIALASGITVLTQNQHPSSQAASNTTPALNTSLNSLPGVISSADSSQTNLPPDALHKLERLYNLLPRIDPLLPLVPHLLSRLRSLAQLHNDSNQFRERLNISTHELTELNQRSKQLIELLNQAAKNFESNEKTIKENLGVVESRIEKVLESIDKLKSS
ncbi:hypothetical protein O181_033331 [Austropuccinia psidii MF-1]|uniref:Dynactin subunit 2 n=1 Tax=Austropuccinia psidii MF-1 TaxID=1389203 RepID=A0A9Q3H704_9BASI|nr:hypothetical protein [Austropuccinia psidii MF-1]